MPGHLGSGGDTTQFGSQSLLDPLELAGQGPHRAWRPVGSTHGIEDRPPNALRCEPIERDPPRLVVATGRLDQTESSGSGQIVTIDVPRKVHGHLEHYVLDERQMLLDQLRQFLVLGLRRGAHGIALP